jgi:hypothetical protein
MAGNAANAASKIAVRMFSPTHTVIATGAFPRAFQIKISY